MNETGAGPAVGHAALEGAVRVILQGLGEDPSRPGLAGTPRRVAESLAFLCSGYGEDPREVLREAVFEEDYNEMVLVKDIELYSLCEHHLIPFFGKCHVAYLPDRKIVGLSKIPRIVDIYARRLQVQERLTTQIAMAVQEVIQPKGVAVVIEARHLCMMMRGVEKQNSVAETSCLLGQFESSQKTRGEFLGLISRSCAG
ncbi:MAG: GTP cyclohydrolase I FolE [Planctomycetes bacterium]|nr:GTP cyclohydrolase I FolE [Planctomycetota bacterium]